MTLPPAAKVDTAATIGGDGKTMAILGRLQDVDGKVVTGNNDADLVCYPICNERHQRGRSLLNWVCEYKVPLSEEPGAHNTTPRREVIRAPPCKFPSVILHRK